MKIGKLFHWLYFIVMMLPILSIPIFAIYSHRHQIVDYSVQVEDIKVVNFNQYVYNNVDEQLSGTMTSENGVLTFDITSQVNNVYSSFATRPISSHKYYIRGSSDYTYASFPVYQDSVGVLYLNTIYTIGDNNNSFYFYSNPNTLLGTYVINLQIFDLTEMFGEGNEPTIEQFDIWYPNDYYDYTLGKKELLKTGNFITYDDTDIGSQFTYDVYNVLDKYFNYDNVFNFGQLYDWLNMTFFNGGASLGFFIFWHLLIYWLLTSILWLVFDVLMYVPQLVHRWLDKASLS